MKRFLALNSNESRWNLKAPLLFIDEKCCKKERNIFLSNIDYKIAIPYGIDSDKRDNDLNYIDSLFFKLIKEISSLLNEVHKLEYPESFWQIIVGPWLENYLIVVFNRFNKIKNAIQNYDLSGVNIINTKNKLLVTEDTISLSKACLNQYWNEVLYSKILETMKSKIEIKYINNDEKLYYFNFKKELNSKETFTSKSKNYLSYILKYFKRDDDAFIISSYLPFIQQMKLYLNLKQVPQIWKSPEIIYRSYNINLRKKFLLSNKNFGEFEKFVRTDIPFSIPICFLEGFNELLDVVSKLPWPRKPKFIFTSNNHDYDEVFKLWTAQKREKNVPYFIGQHGTVSYKGTLLHDKVRSPDKVIGWGENGWGMNKNGFNLKLVGQNFKHDNNGNLLILIAPITTDRKIWDKILDNELNQEWLRKLISNLPKKILKKTILRLPHSYKNHSFIPYESIKKDFPEIKFDFHEKKLKQLFAKSRLVIHCYDSTGILETISSNIPTMCIWPNTFAHMVNDYRKYYELLIEAKILANNPEELSSCIINNWDDPDKWMRNTILKEKVDKFLYKFSNFPPKYATKKLAQHLLNVAIQHNKSIKF